MAEVGNFETALTPEEQRDLRRLVGFIMPPDNKGGVPGADDDAIFADIIRSLDQEQDEVRAALAMLREIAGGDFASLDDRKAEKAAMTLSELKSPAVKALVVAALRCFYRDDRVFRNIQRPATTDPSRFLTSIGAALSDDGKIAELRMQIANGQIAFLPFPAEAAATILVGIERQLGRVFEMQRARLGGHDPAAFFAMGALCTKEVLGTIATDGTPLLSFVLKSGLRLDFPLEKTKISGLIDLLQEFDALANQPMPPPH